MPKKVKVSPKVDILCPKGESNPGPLACQSRALPQDHRGWWENVTIFHRYISNAWKNQLTLKKTATCQTHFGFTNMGSNMYQFRRGGIWNKKFRFGSPCSIKTRSRFLRKNQHFFRQIDVFTKEKLLKRWFHEIFWAWSSFSVLFHTLCWRKY